MKNKQQKSNQLSIPAPECSGGYTYRQVEEIMGDRINEFWKWHYGQTGMICEGRKYNHSTKEYEPECGGISHGMVVYEWDLKRFLGVYGPMAKDLWD